MGLQEAVINLNELKKIGLIQDYAIGGAYAVTVYDVPQATYDLDVFIIVSSESDFDGLSGIYDHFKERGAIFEHEHILIGDMPVQFFPNISPLHNNAIEEAQTVEFEGISIRFIGLEHLILLLLTSFRPKDKIRVGSLLVKADNDKLLSLIERFDNEQKVLFTRYRTILDEAH